MKARWHCHCENLSLTGNTKSFGTEIWFDDRVAVLGGNGSGKSTFLRLLAGERVPHEGQARLGARVVPGFFAQTHARPDLDGRSPVEILMTEHALLINEAMSALARYELQTCARQPFGTLSGTVTNTGLPSGSTAAATIMPFDSRPRSLRGAKLATITTFLPGKSSGT